MKSRGRCLLHGVGKKEGGSGPCQERRGSKAEGDFGGVKTPRLLVTSELHLLVKISKASITLAPVFQGLAEF